MAYENGLINSAFSASTVSLDRRSEGSINALDNNLYAEAKPNNTYNTLQRDTNNAVNARPRRVPDVIYDNVGPGTQPRNQKDTPTLTSQTSQKPVRQRRRRDGIIRVVLMFLIVFVAMIALLLAILLMMGIVGPDCSCDSSGKQLFTITYFLSIYFKFSMLVCGRCL